MKALVSKLFSILRHPATQAGMGFSIVWSTQPYEKK